MVDINGSRISRIESLVFSVMGGKERKELIGKLTFNYMSFCTLVFLFKVWLQMQETNFQAKEESYVEKMAASLVEPCAPQQQDHILTLHRLFANYCQFQHIHFVVCMMQLGEGPSKCSISSKITCIQYTVKVKVAPSCPTLCDPMDYTVHGVAKRQTRLSDFTHFTSLHLYCIQGFCCGSAGKESACNAGDLGSIPGLGRSPGEGKSYPFQYSGMENSMDCIVHWVAKSRTGRSNFHFHCILYTSDL